LKFCTIFWELNQSENDLNRPHSAGPNLAHGYSARLGDLPRAIDRPAAEVGARARCTRGVVTARWPCARRWGGVAGPHAPVGKVSRKWRREHYEGGGEGSPEQRLNVWGQSGGGAVMSHGGGGTPVTGGASGKVL
jgi:hypothetical protein